MQDSKAPEIPPEAYLYFPKGDEIKNQNQRNFFDGNLKFDDQENIKISEFKSYALDHHYALKSMWTDNMILRFLQANDFKMQKTLVSVKEHTVWRETRLPIKLDEDLESLLNSGLLYVHGRDHKFRPIVVFNIYQIDPKTVDMELVTKVLTFWLQYIIDEWMIPGQVEHWVFVINIKGMGMYALAFQSVRKLFTYLQGNFKCRLYQIYLLNSSPSIYTPWQIVKNFLDGDTKRKVEFYKTQLPKRLFEHTNPEQVEQQFGGLAPNCTQFWPPVIPSNNYFISDEDSNNLISQEDYLNLQRDGSLKNTKISPFIKMSESNSSVESYQAKSTISAPKENELKLVNSITRSRITTKENPTGYIHPIFDEDSSKGNSDPNYDDDLDSPAEENYVELMNENSTFCQEKGKIRTFEASFSPLE